MVSTPSSTSAIAMQHLCSIPAAAADAAAAVTSKNAVAVAAATPSASVFPCKLVHPSVA